jgi:hypothetical protein
LTQKGFEASGRVVKGKFYMKIAGLANPHSVLARLREFPEQTSIEVPLMEMARVILFTAQMEKMSRFYGEVLGLDQISNEKGWREFAAGGARIALHSGPSSPGRKGPKIVFHARDVAALRETLVARGAKFGKVGRAKCFASATARTRMVILFNSPTAETRNQVIPQVRHDRQQGFSPGDLFPQPQEWPFNGHIEDKRSQKAECKVSDQGESANPG